MQLLPPFHISHIHPSSFSYISRLQLHLFLYIRPDSAASEHRYPFQYHLPTSLSFKKDLQFSIEDLYPLLHSNSRHADSYQLYTSDYRFTLADH